MASSLSSFVNNLAEGIHKIKCKYKHNDKKCELAELNTKIATAFLNIQTSKMNVYVVIGTIKNKFDENLKKRFLIHTNFLTMISISLFCCWEKVFTLMNI